MGDSIVEAKGWIRLEIGTATRLRRASEATELRMPPGVIESRYLGMSVALTALPESDYMDLPEIAFTEVEAGLGGYLRHELAALWRHREYPLNVNTDRLQFIRDEYLSVLSGEGSSTSAAADVSCVIHLQRVVSGIVPPVVGASCLSWYRSYMSSDSRLMPVVTSMRQFAEMWLSNTHSRQAVAESIVELATECSEGIGDLLTLSV